MKEYLKLIDQYLKKELPFDKFTESIHFLYAKDPNLNNLSKGESDFVYHVYEKSTYAEKPEYLPKNDPDRKHGLIDSEQYYDWLKNEKQKNITFWDKYRNETKVE